MLPRPCQVRGFAAARPVALRLHRSTMAATASSLPSSASSELPCSKSPALEFQVVAQQGRARASLMKLPHVTAQLPMFMPVGTHGTVKGLTSQQLEEIDCHVVLGNAYHLENRPGSELVEAAGGLHDWIRWPRGMLTDSGGFQMVSLLELAEITEEGVTFRSPLDGRRMLLTPEHSIAIQNRLGADIIMQLDDVVSSTNTDPARFEEATYRTTRWLDRCIKAHARPQSQSLFPIVQGGLDTALRDVSIRQLTERNCPGYAIGGLAGGEDKHSFWRIVSHCTAKLPQNKPRYVMGIGYPEDIVVCSALGADMYDSVFPTRTARFGVAVTWDGMVKLKNARYEHDMAPIDASCSCVTCRKYSRAFLHNVVTKGYPYASILVTYHNVTFMKVLSRRIHESIQQQRFPEWVRGFLHRYYSDGVIPDWIPDALQAAGIAL